MTKMKYRCVVVNLFNRVRHGIRSAAVCQRAASFRKRTAMRIQRYMGLVLLAASTGLAIADHHPNATAVEGPNNGLLIAAGDNHVELLVGHGEVLVWLTDHNGQPVSSAVANGMVILKAKGVTRSVPVDPAGTNLLRGEDEQVHPGQHEHAVVHLDVDGRHVHAELDLTNRIAAHDH